MVNVEQLKSHVLNMPADAICEALLELRMDGVVIEYQTPFNRLHFNTCFAEIEALFQRAGYHRQIDVLGYEGQIYALFDPSRKSPVDVLRWLKRQYGLCAVTSLASVAHAG
ncbi:transcriptional regulator [Pseudomonas sp. NPDC090202]|uniref:transcriptional regulator n=1 Tax=unclassified Pseudomonas TaxID=196821 RepID=UPI00380BB11A